MDEADRLQQIRSERALLEEVVLSCTAEIHNVTRTCRDASGELYMAARRMRR